ncbi:MAG: LytTR family DNA-binding domain-containing protein [Pseudomonadota bacterium]
MSSAFGPATTIRSIIVDDEPLARDLLKRLIEKEADVRLLASCSNGEQAAETVQALSPDLVFLDIEMPGEDGLALAERLSALPNPPHIVFVTAYNRFAIEAFELNAIDYLIKPVSKERCRNAMARVREVLRKDSIVELASRLIEVVRNVEGAAEDRPEEQHLVLSKNDVLRSVPLSNIQWAEAANQYVSIHTTDGCYLMSESLGQFASRIADPRFLRVHRSALVNAACVARVSRNANGTHALKLKDGTELTLARSRASLLPALLRISADGNA